MTSTQHQRALPAHVLDLLTRMKSLVSPIIGLCHIGPSQPPQKAPGDEKSRSLKLADLDDSIFCCLRRPLEFDHHDESLDGRKAL